MDIPRELVYEDKNNIEVFGVDDESSLNYLIYEDWLLNQTNLQPTKSGYPQRKLKAFNDAYYICTLILMHNTNDKFLKYAIDRIELPSIVFPLVYIYISTIKKKSTNISRLLKTIKTAIRSEKWDVNFDELNSIVQRCADRVTPDFAPRQLTPEILTDIKWYKTIGGYKEQDMLTILKYISKSEDEWLMMIDAIKNAAQEYEWEYNQDLEFFDDDGNWCKDTPINLMSFYQFCDDIKDKYNEYKMQLNSLEQSNITEIESPIRAIGRPKAKPFNEFIMRGTPSCFMPILHEMLDGKYGLEAAKIVKACVGFWISKPQIKSVTNEFPSIKSNAFSTAFNNPSKFTAEDLDQVREEIQEKIMQNTDHTGA